MTKRSALKPVYVASTEKKPETFAQRHKVMVIAVKGQECLTLRFTNPLRAMDSIAWHVDNGYFARIV